jgi:hypothetical protein
MKKIIVFLFLFFVKVNSFAESNNLTLLCDGLEEFVAYPVKTNIIDETVSKHISITYVIKNNLLLPNEISMNSPKCDFRENTIHCRMNDSSGNYRLVTIDRISGKVFDEARMPFEVMGSKSSRKHFNGICKTAKKQF